MVGIVIFVAIYAVLYLILFRRPLPTRDKALGAVLLAVSFFFWCLFSLNYTGISLNALLIRWLSDSAQIG